MNAHCLDPVNSILWHFEREKQVFDEHRRLVHATLTVLTPRAEANLTKLELESPHIVEGDIKRVLAECKDTGTVHNVAVEGDAMSKTCLAGLFSRGTIERASWSYAVSVTNVG